MAFVNMTAEQKAVTYKGLAAFALACLVIAAGMPLRWLFFKSPLPFTVVVPIFFVAAVVHSFWRMGWRRMVVFLPLSLIVCTLAELVSTYSGFPFGEYVYNTDRVGAKILWTIPWTVPLAWFTMIYPSLIIANLLVEGHPATGKTTIPRIFLIAAVGAGVVTVWDLALDPHMVNYESAWTWRYADTCWQETCKERSAGFQCTRDCKAACTRPETRGQCRKRLKKASGDGAVDMTLCDRESRLAHFVTRCAAQCETAASDGVLEEACEELISEAEGVVVEAEKAPGSSSTASLVDLCKDIKSRDNWKLACERECCDQECEADCAAAVPIRSHDDEWWADQGGKAWMVGTTPLPTLLREKASAYYDRGWYFCIPFSNFYGWLLTSGLVFLLYGFAKKLFIVRWEEAARHKRAGDFLLAWAHAVPHDLTLFSEGSLLRAVVKKAAVVPQFQDLDVKVATSPLTNVEKLITLGGMGIYFGVSWCNVLFAYPSGLVLIALFGMLIPLLAAIFRLYAWKGGEANRARMYERAGD